jgi:hypothetical protein
MHWQADKGVDDSGYVQRPELQQACNTQAGRHVECFGVCAAARATAGMQHTGEQTLGVFQGMCSGTHATIQQVTQGVAATLAGWLLDSNTPHVCLTVAWGCY